MDAATRAANQDDFLMKEARYTSLKKSFPAEADELFAAAEELSLIHIFDRLPEGFGHRPHRDHDVLGVRSSVIYLSLIHI